MRLIVAGSRGFNDYPLMARALDAINQQETVRVVLSGTARGADTLGERWAFENRVRIERHPAEWNKYGKSAGYRRNAEMADAAHGLLAAWDGSSPGTQHMIDLATGRGLRLWVIRTDILEAVNDYPK